MLLQAATGNIGNGAQRCGCQPNLSLPVFQRGMGAEIRGGRSSRWAIDSDKPDQVAFSSLRDEETRQIEQDL
jgi:hypothetical protein